MNFLGMIKKEYKKYPTYNKLLRRNKELQKENEKLTLVNDGLFKSFNEMRDKLNEYKTK